MLRKVAFVVALSTVLTACNSSGLVNGPNPIITPQQITDGQSAVKSLCAVVPTAVTVVSLFTANPAFIAAGGTFSAFAKEVCDAITAFRTAPNATARAVAPTGSLPTLYGVPIKVY